MLRRIWQVAAFHVLYLLLFAGSALLLVPDLGIRGYAWAEVAALPSFVLLLIWFQVHVGRLRYARAGVWFAAWAIPLFSWQLGPWVWTSILVPLILPTTRKDLLQAVAMVLRRT